MMSKNKNKFFLLILAIIFVLSLVACVPSDTDDNGNDDDNNPPVGDPGTPFTDATLLTRDYAGKDFFTDGIGAVTLVNCVDGDTAIFRSSSKGTFTVRFLGIDTPESTYKLEPWGSAASNFTKTKLTGASEIVLETEAPTPELDSTGDRYLAWVWADGRLLNLELIEQSFTASKSVTGSKYQQTLYDADMRIQTYRLKIWGTEKDPAFDYSKQGIEKTIEELRTTPLPMGTKVRIQGIVARVVGYSAYIMEKNAEGKWFGVYVYGGFNQIRAFKVGYGVVIEASTGQFNGVFQLTDTRDSKVIVTSMGHVIEPQLVTADDLNINTNPTIENLLVKIENLTITGGYDTESNNGYTLFAKTADGKSINIRVDTDTHLHDENNQLIDTYNYFLVNHSKMTIVGIVGQYDGEYQIMLTDMNDIQYLN